MTRKGSPKGPLWKFLLVDLGVIPVALFLAFFVRFQEARPENTAIYIRLVIPIILIRLGILFIFRLYDFSRNFTKFDVIYFTGAAMIVAHTLEGLVLLYAATFMLPSHQIAQSVLFLDYIMQWLLSNQELMMARMLEGFMIVYGDTILESSYEISRSIFLLNFFFSWIGACFWRILYLERRKRWAYDRTRILIVGAGVLGESVLRDIQQYSRLGHQVIGLIDDDIENRTTNSSAPIIGKMNQLHDRVKKHEIDEIIVTSQMANRQELLDILSRCQSTGCKVRLLPELYEVTIGKVEVSQVAGIPLITVSTMALTDWGTFVKRTMDIVVSSLGLITLAILFPFLAAAIKLSSAGPILYRQERIGKDGKLFTLNKFRTMYHKAETQTGPVLSWDKDPRVTPVGRFLRRWHLDEMPQLINVLKGEMSLVGPRPERAHFATHFEKEIPAYRLRETVRPGMTGLAQIHGFYHSPIEHKLRYDLAYINNMSFLLDLKILFLTLWVTFFNHGQQPISPREEPAVKSL